MKKLIILFLIFPIVSSVSLAQSNAIELEATALGRVPFSINQLISPSSFVGINYQKAITPKLVGIIGFGGMSNNYFDHCKNCADHYVGSTRLRWWQTSLGLRYMFRQEINYYRKTWKERFDYYLELNALYQHIKTNGNYGGGFGGGSLISNNNFKGLGGAVKIGSIYKATSRIYAGLNLAFYLSRGSNQVYTDNFSSPPELTNLNESIITLPLEIRVGYRF